MKRCLALWCVFRLLLMGWLLLPFNAGADGQLHLLLSDSGGAYQEAAEAFRAAYGQRRPVRTWTLDEVGPQQVREWSGENDLIVPIGLAAAHLVADNHVGQAAVLTIMIPSVSAERLSWPAVLPRRKISYVYIDQPSSRSLGLVDAAFSQAKRVGLVVSTENAGNVKLLRQEAARRHLKLNIETVARSEEVASALRNVLPESDVLLLLPDSLAIHAGNAKNVLLTTYRYRVPVVGFSRGLSRAGAVAAVYSSPAQIGRQGARMALRWKPEAGDLPPAQHADEFSVDFNPYVARSLGVVLPDLDDVRRKVGADDEP
ncbi:MAG: ABC transporter substrate binding protein [Gallionellaceae bacterium]|nr:ABC transporter substrate binding protein [Gallionellaceae bacterium]